MRNQGIKPKFSCSLKPFQFLIIVCFTALLTVLGYYYLNNYSNSDSIIKGYNTKFLSSYIPKSINTKKSDSAKYITKYLDTLKGKYKVYIRVFSTGYTYKYHEDEAIYAASLYKVPVAVAALKYIQDTNASLDDKLIYLRSDYSGGTGIINTYPFGREFTVSEVLSYLLKYSDNSAQTMLLRYVPNEYLDKSFNLVKSFKNGNQLKEQNIASAYIYSNYLELINYGNFLNTENRNYLFNLMKVTQFDDRLSPHITKYYDFSHKIGSWANPSSWHDCGIVFKKDSNESLAVVCVMSSSAEYDEFLGVSKAIGDFVVQVL